MIEKQSINGREVWLEVEPYHVDRKNPKTIPTEYFTAKYYLAEPNSASGESLRDDNGEIKLFESPVAALSFATQRLGKIM